MAQTLTRLLTHIVFSTKGRRPWIGTEIEMDQNEGKRVAPFPVAGPLCSFLGK